jgi:MazG family protein
VADTIAQKLVRRHPHVFGREKVSSAAEVTTAWERIKAEEKRDSAAPEPRSVLDGVPKTLPALLRTHRLSERAARVGFDWDNPRQVIAKLREELDELEEVLDQDPAHRAQGHLAWEIGDVLLAIANLARHLGECGEDLLREANRRFENRFRLVERLAREKDIKMAEASIETLESLWQEAKKILASKKDL